METNKLIMLYDNTYIDQSNIIFKNQLNIFFNMPKGLNIVNIALKYLLYSVLNNNFRYSIASRIINNDINVISTAPKDLIEMTLAIKNAFLQAFEKIPNEYKTRSFSLDKVIIFNICSSDIINLNFLYVFIPFSKTRSFYKNEKTIMKYFNDIIEEVCVNKYEKPHIHFVRKDTKIENIYNKFIL